MLLLSGIPILAFLALSILCISSSSGVASGVEADDGYGFDGRDGGYDSYADMMEQMKGMGMGGGGMGMDPYGQYEGGGGGEHEDEDGYGGEGEGEGGRAPASAVTILHSVQEAQDWADDSETSLASVIGFFDSISHSADMQAFETVARRLSKALRWAVVTNTPALEEAKCKGACVSLYRASRLVSAKHNERARYRYPSAQVQETGLETWALLKAPPLVGELSASSGSDVLYARSALPTLVLFSDADPVSDAKGYQYLRSRALKVAADNAGKLVVALARTSEHTKALTVDYGLGDLVFDKTGAIAVGVMFKDRRWSLDSDTPFTAAALAQFARNYLSGALGQGRAAVRSSKTMSESEMGELEAAGGTGIPVTVTSDSFQKIVLDPTKDVLIEFHAPWCGHCKALAPEYAQVAKFYASKPDVVIAAMDMDAHRPPKGFDVQGFPTIMLVQTGEKNSKPLSYEGEREAADIIEWLEKQRRSL